MGKSLTHMPLPVGDIHRHACHPPIGERWIRSATMHLTQVYGTILGLGVTARTEQKYLEPLSRGEQGKRSEPTC